MTTRKNLIGCRYGRLVVISPSANKGKHTAWKCLCDCGTESIVTSNQLRCGYTQSCGCLGKEKRLERNTKHGQAKRNNRTREYVMWCAAKSRAKRADVPFSIKLEDIIIPEFCPVLGVRLEEGTLQNHANSPSLDRLDPSLGYVQGNIWVISHRANLIKNDASLDELKKVVLALEAR